LIANKVSPSPPPFPPLPRPPPPQNWFRRAHSYCDVHVALLSGALLLVPHFLSRGGGGAGAPGDMLRHSPSPRGRAARARLATCRHLRSSTPPRRLAIETNVVLLHMRPHLRHGPRTYDHRNHLGNSRSEANRHASGDRMLLDFFGTEVLERLQKPFLLICCPGLACQSWPRGLGIRVYIDSVQRNWNRPRCHAWLHAVCITFRDLWRKCCAPAGEGELPACRAEFGDLIPPTTR